MLLIDCETLPLLPTSVRKIGAELVDDEIRVTIDRGSGERGLQLFEAPLSDATHTEWLVREGLTVRGVPSPLALEAAKRIVDCFFSAPVRQP